MTDWTGNLDHLQGTTASSAFDAVDRLEARVAELEAALQDAIDFAAEGWAYSSDYFIEKWDYWGERAKLYAALGKPDPQKGERA